MYNLFDVNCGVNSIYSLFPVGVIYDGSFLSDISTLLLVNKK